MTGVWAKFRRAEHHAQAFERLLAGFLESDSYAVAVEFDAETGWHHFRWSVMKEPPREEFAVLFGDMLYNLRASLDYLVWQLVLANGEVPDRGNSFPAAKSPKAWAAAQGNDLRGVHPVWIAEIDKLQPYKRVDRPEVHMLAILDYVNNLNKHRVLPITLADAETWEALFDVRSVPDGEQIEHFFDPTMKHAADLFRIRCASKVKLNVKMNPKPPIRVSFSDGLNYDWVNADLVHWVFHALARFEPAFPS